MTWNRGLTEMQQTLSKLYSTADRSQEIVEKAEVPTGRINFYVASLDRWRNILVEADKHEKVQAIVAIAQAEYPAQRDDLARAERLYLPTPDHGSQALTEANYLSAETLQRLREAAVQADLVDSGIRDLLLAGIDPQYVASLPLRRSPWAQLWSDLSELNHAPVQADNQLPLRIWLMNANYWLGSISLVEQVASQKALAKWRSSMGREPPSPAKMRRFCWALETDGYA